MIKDFTVLNQYADKETGRMTNQVYDFDEFVVHHAYQLKRQIEEVELALARLEGTKNKDLWAQGTRDSFYRIRQKLLNSANAIERLPKTLCYQGTPCASMKASEVLARMIDRK